MTKTEFLNQSFKDLQAILNPTGIVLTISPSPEVCVWGTNPENTSNGWTAITPCKTGLKIEWVKNKSRYKKTYIKV